MNVYTSGQQKVIPAVLVYIFCQSRLLMIAQKDIWNALGGKFEKGESPEQAAIREVKEESGIEVVSGQLGFLGQLYFPNFKADKQEDWWVSVFRVDLKKMPLLQESGEGQLKWQPIKYLSELPMWPGDRIFLPSVLAARPFSGTLWYEKGTVTKVDFRDLPTAKNLFSGLGFPVVLGALGGTLGDSMHVLTNTLSYTPSSFVRLPFSAQPLWVPLLFAGAGFTIALSHRLTDLLRSPFRKSPILDLKKRLFLVLVLLLSWGFSGVVDSLGLLILVAALVWYFFERTLGGLYQAMWTAIIGCSIEIILIQQGLFFYEKPHSQFFGIPVWLATLYWMGSVCLAQLDRHYSHRSKSFISL